MTLSGVPRVRYIIFNYNTMDLRQLASGIVFIICDVYENRSREGRSFLVVVNGFALTNVP